MNLSNDFFISDDFYAEAMDLSEDFHTKAQELSEGDMIDLEVVFSEVGGDENLDSDVHEYELAVVEGVSIEGDEVLILTNQHNVMVPINFTVRVSR